MSRCRKSSSPPCGTLSRPGALQSTSQLHIEQKLSAAGVCPINAATQTSDTKRVKARERVSADGKVLRKDASANESTSGRSVTRNIEGEAAEAKQPSRSTAWSNGNQHGGKHKGTQASSNRFKSRANTQKSTRGVVYLGHVPSGFNEPQMLRFFSQFGEVVGVELRRSRKTGHSKGYAYVGFELPEVAEVVAETMNNYMMFGRTLHCEVVAPSRMPPRLFRNWGKKFRRLSTRVRAVQQHNKPENALPSQRQVKRRLERERKVAKVLKNLGVKHVAPTVFNTVLKNDIEKVAGASKESCEPPPEGKKSQPRKVNTFSRVKGKGKKRGKKYDTRGGRKIRERSAQLRRTVEASPGESVA